MISAKSSHSRSPFCKICERSERYVIFLSFDTIRGGRHKVLLDSFLQEFVDLSQINADCAGPICIPLERYHVALVDPDSCLEQRDGNEPPDWLSLARLHEQFAQDRASSPTNAADPSDRGQDAPRAAAPVTLSSDELDVALSDQIHALADKLPPTGHYLDVIWLVSGRLVGLPSSNVALYGALWRLSSWHGALLTLVPESETKEKAKEEEEEEEEEEGKEEDDRNGPSSALQESLHAWANHFQGRVAVTGGRQSALEAAGRDVAWRGELLLADGKGQKSVRVPGFILRPRLRGNSGICLRSLDRPDVGGSPAATATRSHPSRKIVTFSGQLEVGSTVRRADVPNIFLSPVTLSLYPLQLLSGSGLPRSEAFLHWLSEVAQSGDAALVMRLTCRTMAAGNSALAKARSALGYQAWKERVKNCSGDLTMPDLNLRETQEFFYLLVHCPGGSSEDVVAQVMYSASELSGEAHARLASYQQSLSFDDPKKDGSTINNLPSLDGQQVRTLLETIKLAQAEAIKTLLEEREAEGGEPVISASELQLLMGTVYSTIMARVDAMATEAEAGECGEGNVLDADIVSELDVSPSQWPERLALQNHAALEKKIKRFKSGEMMLAGMPVPAPANNTITLTAEEFLKHFQASGLPTAQDLSPVAPACPNNGGNSCPSLPSWADLKAASFEEAQKSSLPGILYCLDSGRSQQLDRRFSRMQQRYVRYETSSTCSSEQAASPATLTLPQHQQQQQQQQPSSPRPDPKGARTPRGGHRQRPARRWSGGARGQGSAAKGQTSAEKRRRAPALAERAGRKMSPGSLVRAPRQRGNEEPAAKTVSQEKKRLVPTRTSPRKRIVLSGKPDQAQAPAPTKDSAAAAASAAKPRKLSNSERTRLKLRQVVKETIISRGITKDSVCYKPCMERLYRMTELYVKDLTSSRGLIEEMKKIAEANADFVVQFEQNRMNKS